MISKPINSVVKKKFQEIHKEAVNRALNDFEVFECKLNSLNTHFERFKFIYDEHNRLEEIIDNHSHPYYIENHSSENSLLDQYAGRSYILNVDDAKELFEAIYLGTYNCKIGKRLWELKKEIPKYSYQEFSTGKICKYLDNFEKAYNIDEVDYYKIREWQAEQLVKIVNYEYKMLIRKVQRHCKTLSEPLKFILEEKEKIEAIDKMSVNGEVLKQELSQLYILNELDWSPVDRHLLERNFQIYKDERITWQGVYPELIKSLLDKVNQKYKKPFGSETTLFFVINKVAEWYELVLNGQSVQQEVQSPDWDKLFERLMEEGKRLAEEAIEPIADYAYNQEISKDDVKTYLIDKLEVYRRKFNSFEKKYLFGVVDEEKRETLRRMFITNSFFGNDLQGEYDAIKEALIIHEVSWEIVGIYGHIFDTRKIDYPEKSGAHLEILSLLNQMVIDKEIYNELRLSMDNFIEHFHVYRLPIEIHFQNQRETMSELFTKSLNRLEMHLDDAEPTNKILYLQSRLKELRHQELRYKQIQHELDDDDDNLRYSTLFKEFLEIEADFVKNTREINQHPTLSYAHPKSLNPVSSSKTFDEVFPNEKGNFILQMLEDLSVTTNGICLLTERKKGALRGIVDALLQNNFAPQLSIPTLTFLIADKIKMDLKSTLDVSNLSRQFHKKANTYILANHTLKGRYYKVL
jgi:hypothetical protein